MPRNPKAPEKELTQQQKEAIWKALHEEEASIRRAVGNASVAWAGLESVLSHIFLTLAFEQKDVEIAGVIFYTPSNFESRISMVDNLMSYHFTVNAIPQTYMPQIYSIWPKLRGRIQTKQSRRNAIIHGNLMNQQRGASLRDRNIRLTPAFLDVLRQHKFRASKQLPGMSSNDIIQFTNGVVRLAGLLIDYNLILKAYQKGRKAARGPILQDQELFEAVNLLATKMTDQSQNNQDQGQTDRHSHD